MLALKPRVGSADWLKFSGWFGSGLEENVCEAYNFLASNYVPGDEVFFFGFSRGAYTARATAGLVAEVGICQDIQMSRFWEMYTVYKTKDPRTPMEETEWGKLHRNLADKSEKELTDDDMITVSAGDKDIEAQKVRKGDGYWWLSYCHKPVIKIVGVFETVGSLGYPANIIKDVTEWNKKYAFHNTDIHPGENIRYNPFSLNKVLTCCILEIENAFQALALDEPRASMIPTLWNLPAKSPDQQGNQTNLIQCWFPGVHINIGGGSQDGLKKTPKGDLECMANTSFAWMVDRCRPFLRFEEKVLSFITQQYFEKLQKLTDRSVEKSTSGWGVGPYQKAFKGVLNTIIGEEIRTPGHYLDKLDAREYIHPVVFHAMENQNYTSKALEGFKRISNGEGKGHSWVKSYTPKDKQSWSEWAGFKSRTVEQTPESVTVTIPEFVIPKMVVQEGSYSHERYYASPLERLLILRNQWNDDQTNEAFESEERFRQRKDSIIGKQAASGYLTQLDKDNSATKYIGEAVSWGTSVPAEPEKPSDPFLSGS